MRGALLAAALLAAACGGSDEPSLAEADSGDAAPTVSAEDLDTGGDTDETSSSDDGAGASSSDDAGADDGGDDEGDGNDPVEATNDDGDADDDSGDDDSGDDGGDDDSGDDAAADTDDGADDGAETDDGSVDGAGTADSDDAGQTDRPTPTPEPDASTPTPGPTPTPRPTLSPDDLVDEELDNEFTEESQTLEEVLETVAVEEPCDLYTAEQIGSLISQWSADAGLTADLPPGLLRDGTNVDFRLETDQPTTCSWFSDSQLWLAEVSWQSADGSFADQLLDGGEDVPGIGDRASLASDTRGSFLVNELLVTVVNLPPGHTGTTNDRSVLLTLMADVADKLG